MSAQGSFGDFKTQVLQAVDLVDLIGRSVALKRRGKDYVGLCPFHQEKTPSFHVSPSKQLFHCYGCKAGGTAFDFVIKRDRVEFIEALRTLAEMAGLEMPQGGGRSREQSEQRKGLLEANSAACAFFEKLLADPQVGLPARQYLEKRGFNEESVRRFRIGLAPAGWDGLLKALTTERFSLELLVAAGLVKQREDGRRWDTFRNRLMFPIRDEAGRIIAFGGRVMPGSEDPAKYLNSPETPLFSKGRCVFGIDLARQKIVGTRTAAVVEGYTDVVMSHQYGASNVVSVLGTAMTEQHLAILRRFADRIVLLFDADAAGDAAVDRAIALFLQYPVEIAIASMPAGVDPDEYLMEHGSGKFEDLLKTAPDALSYKWKSLQKQYRSAGSDLTGRQKVVETYLKLVADARGAGPVDPLRWGAVLAQVNRLTEVPMDELNRRFRPPRRPVSRVRPGGSSGRYGADGQKAQVGLSGGPTNGSPEAASDAPPAPGPRTADQRAQSSILGVLLAHPRLWQQVQARLPLEVFTDECCRRLAEIYWSYQRNEGEPVFNEFLAQLPDAQCRELALEVFEETSAHPDPQQTLADAVRHLVEVRPQLDQEQELVSMLRRTTQEPLSEDREVALLAELAKKKTQPNLHRFGPVRSAGS